MFFTNSPLLVGIPIGNTTIAVHTTTGIIRKRLKKKRNVYWPQQHDFSPNSMKTSTSVSRKRTDPHNVNKTGILPTERDEKINCTTVVLKLVGMNLRPSQFLLAFSCHENF